jgi:hypothetical protein
VSQRLVIALLFLVACGGEKKGSFHELSGEPVSVRGWILDTKGAKPAESPDVEVARRTLLFQSTSVWVENSQYASGGVAGNGAFVVLDVQPISAVIGFNAPGAETAQIVLKGVPGNADVLIPNVILEPGGAKVLDPSKILIRLPSSDVDKPTPTGKTAIVAGYTVPILNTPLSDLRDRRDYPETGDFHPVAVVK